MDFLQHFGMAMDLKAGKLIHLGIQTPFSGASSSVRGGGSIWYMMLCDRFATYFRIFRSSLMYRWQQRLTNTGLSVSLRPAQEDNAGTINPRKTRHSPQVLRDDVSSWYLPALKFPLELRIASGSEKGGLVVTIVV